jgi:predicted nucleotidyltransferase
MFLNFEKIRSALAAVAEIEACYLFGSAAKQEAVVNDLDLLILVRPGADPEKAIWDLNRQVTDAMNIGGDKVDILLFDFQQADPEVLFHAVNEGILLKNESPDLLTDNIEALSRYLVAHEQLISEANRLKQELIEELLVDG